MDRPDTGNLEEALVIRIAAEQCLRPPFYAIARADQAESWEVKDTWESLAVWKQHNCWLLVTILTLVNRT